MLALCLIAALLGQDPDPAAVDRTSDVLGRLRLPPYSYSFLVTLTESDFQAPDETPPEVQVATARERIERGDDTPASHSGLAKALARAGRASESAAEHALARQGYAKAIEQAPEDWQLRYDYSVALSGGQAFEPAANELRTILAHQPTFWQAARRLACHLILRRVQPVLLRGPTSELAPILDEVEALAKQSLAAEPDEQHCWTKLMLGATQAMRVGSRDGRDALLTDRAVFAEIASALDDASSRWPGIAKIKVLAELVRVAPILTPALTAKAPSVAFEAAPESDRGELGRVEHALLDVVHAHSDCEAAWVGLAAISYATGKIGEALERLALGSRSERVTSLLEGRFVLAFTQQSWSECELLGAALLHRADTGRHRCLMGKLNDRENDLVAAEQEYRTATARSDAQPEAWIGLAIVLTKRRAAMTEIDDALARARDTAQQRHADRLDSFQSLEFLGMQIAFTKAVARAVAGDRAAAREEIDDTMQLLQAFAARDAAMVIDDEGILQTYIELWRDSLTSPSRTSATARACEQLGDLYEAQHKSDAALTCYRDAIAFLAAVKPADLSPASRESAASCRVKQAAIELERGSHEGVLELCRDAVAILDSLAEASPVDSPSRARQSAYEYQHIAWLQARCGARLSALRNDFVAAVELALLLERDRNDDWAQRALVACGQHGDDVTRVRQDVAAESLDDPEEAATTVQKGLHRATDGGLAASSPTGAGVRLLASSVLDMVADRASCLAAEERRHPLMVRVLAAYQELADEEDASVGVLNGCAWLLLTSEPDDLRAPAAALRYAERAARLSNRNDAFVLDTLALAQEATGDHRQAVATQARAIVLLDPGTPVAKRQEFAARLAKYQAALDAQR